MRSRTGGVDLVRRGQLAQCMEMQLQTQSRENKSRVEHLCAGLGIVERRRPKALAIDELWTRYGAEVPKL